jgi:phospholipid/cholesterol/gamma-HCH transport system ATP-binding protein
MNHTSQPSPPAIAVTGLEVAYDSVAVLKGIDLEVKTGERLLVVGGSGCGKSTLLKSIIGLNQPTAGVIRLLDRELAAQTETERKALLRRIGVMFQYGALLNSLSVGDNVSLPLQMHTSLRTVEIEALVQARLEMVGLGHAFALMPDQLSGGMRKRAALARALALEPEILFCDEPGAGLDPVTAAGIDALLLTLNRTQDTTLVVVTHELLSIERLDGRLVMLDEGRVLFDGPVQKARQSSDTRLRHFFDPSAIDD